MPKEKEAKAKPGATAKGKEAKADEKKRGRSKEAKEEAKVAEPRSASKSQKAVSKSAAKSADKPAGRGKKADREESKRRSTPTKSPAKAGKKRKARESKGSGDDAKKKKKAKKVKDPTAPKGACGAYIQFTTVMVPAIRAEHTNPDGSHTTDPATGEPFKHTAFMALAGHRWAALDEDGKAKYVQLAEADKARWVREKAEHDEHGYYTRADGTKSNDGVSSTSKTTKAPVEDDEPFKKKPSAKTQAKAKAKEKETLVLASESGNSSD